MQLSFHHATLYSFSVFVLFPFFLQIAIAFTVVCAGDKTSTNSTAGVTKTKDARGKRNLNLFGNYGASRRNDGYNYQPAGYSKLIAPHVASNSIKCRFHPNRLRAEQLHWRWSRTRLPSVPGSARADHRDHHPGQQRNTSGSTADRARIGQEEEGAGPGVLRQVPQGRAFGSRHPRSHPCALTSRAQPGRGGVRRSPAAHDRHAAATAEVDYSPHDHPTRLAAVRER